MVSTRWDDFLYGQNFNKRRKPVFTNHVISSNGRLTYLGRRGARYASLRLALLGGYLILKEQSLFSLAKKILPN
jgi:hypothetical protein